jgi:hypothetical protein
VGLTLDTQLLNKVNKEMPVKLEGPDMTGPAVLRIFVMKM